MARGGDIMELFIKYLEDRMVGVVGPELAGTSEGVEGPEVGEEGPPDHALLYRGGAVTLIPATASELASRGLSPYPHVYLTTEHALTLTRALATLHAHTLLDRHSQNPDPATAPDQSSPAQPHIVPVPTSPSSGGSSEETPSSSSVEEEGEGEEGRPMGQVDRWTAQVSQLGVVEANLSVLVDALHTSGGNERTVRRLEALRGDLPTLTQFLRFASAMQTCRVPSVGPVCVGDVWVPEEGGADHGEEVVAVRLRGGAGLQAPPLRDAAWSWLTLLAGDTLRERYMELCDEYCAAFNKTLLRREGAGRGVEELSYFEVMRDLGENFLHAFLTVIHKFVVSGKWFFDRQLHTEAGLRALLDLVGFLVDNGIVGSIFVL